jgi:hypothetical protein
MSGEATSVNNFKVASSTMYADLPSSMPAPKSAPTKSAPAGPSKPAPKGILKKTADDVAAELAAEAEAAGVAEASSPPPPPPPPPPAGADGVEAAAARTGERKLDPASGFHYFIDPVTGETEWDPSEFPEGEGPGAAARGDSLDEGTCFLGFAGFPTEVTVAVSKLETDEKAMYERAKKRKSAPDADDEDAGYDRADAGGSNKRVRFAGLGGKVVIKGIDVQATVAKISAHLLSDKKFGKASGLLQQLVEAELRPETASVFFTALQAIMPPAVPLARLHGEKLRAAHLALVSAAHDKLGSFTAAQQPHVRTWAFMAVTTNQFFTDDTYQFANAAKRLKQAAHELEALGEGARAEQDEHNRPPPAAPAAGIMKKAAVATAAEVAAERRGGLLACMEHMLPMYHIKWAQAPIRLSFQVGTRTGRTTNRWETRGTMTAA